MYYVLISIGILLLLFALFIIIVLIYGFATKKNQEVYKTRIKSKEETIPQKAKKYCDNAENILKKYESDENYEILKDALTKLPSVYNSYISEILGTKKISKSSISPAVAAALGNSIGGFPCGIAMGMSALEKKEYRKKQIQEFDKKCNSIKNIEQKLVFLVKTIDNIVGKENYN